MVRLNSSSRTRSTVPRRRRGSLIENDPRQVIHEVVALEAYLDDYLKGAGLTYEEWVETFSRGSYHARNLLIVELAAALQPRNVLEFACAGPHLARQLVDSIPNIQKYTCSNFSPRMVELAAAQLADRPRCRAALVDADVTRSS